MKGLRMWCIGLFAIDMIIVGVVLYNHVTTPTYSIPGDPISLRYGPTDGASKWGNVSELRLTAHVNRNVIAIWGRVNFADPFRTHFLDIYLPFVVTGVPGSGDSGLDIDRHVSSGGTCSLVHVNIPEGWGITHDYIKLDIGLQSLVAIKRYHEDTTILTFGPAVSDERASLEEFFGEKGDELLKLTPVKVSIGVDKECFFSSDTFPAPDVEYISEDYRFASWLVTSSGPFADYYRSIHCTARNPDKVQHVDFALLLSGVFISLGASLLINGLLKDVQ